MEIIANALQEVKSGSDVVFTDTVVEGNNCMVHREVSGLVTLKGMTNQYRAKYKVSFGCNAAAPNEKFKPIALAIAIDGEPVYSSTMQYAPVAADAFGNLFASVFIDVPRGCCSQISVQNIGNGKVLIQNANLIIERVA